MCVVAFNLCGQMLVKDSWGENMATTVASTGNINSSIFYVSFEILASIMFANLFVGIICAAFVRNASVHNKYREIEQTIVAESRLRRVFSRVALRSRVRGAARLFREQCRQETATGAASRAVRRLSSLQLPLAEAASAAAASLPASGRASPSRLSSWLTGLLTVSLEPSRRPLFSWRSPRVRDFPCWVRSGLRAVGDVVMIGMICVVCPDRPIDICSHYRKRRRRSTVLPS